eukprot:CCRYP_015455-RA/>CCRYP_015455-RA protein AED:0.35 eAED:0.35 QI:186/1/1/1/1/1/3/36/782
MKRRPLKGFDEGSSSSEDENDAFAAAISKKNKRPRPLLDDDDDGEGDKLRRQDSNNSKTHEEAIDAGTSAKRHHHMNAARQVKMDALLSELQSTKPTDPSPAAVGAMEYGSIEEGESYFGPGSMNHRPNKMGSYVEPGQEHLTTNIFVGNLDPCTTEEELTDVFREFGDLYSVKIMWPRTAEERARNRNTGFVCFMSRKDAENAMEAYCDADPLETGRRMLLRWGKNVKKTVKFGTGGVPTHFRKKPRADKSKIKGARPTNAERSGIEEGTSFQEASQISGSEHNGNANQNDSFVAPTLSSGQEEATKRILPVERLGPVYDPSKHAASAIVVTTPSDPRRAKFITTVASFVAKDGSILEQKLIEAQSSNPDFQFLLPVENDTCRGDYDNERLAEHIFYRWRVYAFAQGDGLNSWRTTPFVMIEPHGRFWIPPSLNVEEAQREEEAEKRREQSRMAAQEERRKLADEKDHIHMTGRQIERATGNDRRGAIKLNDWEKEKFHDLLRNKLCATQESICEAMAFAFDKSGAAIEISQILKEALLESTNGISVDTRIARLFLLSDILFNSQQPGVRNAFQYRDAIEAMSPEVFESLGKHGNGKAGRMTMNRLRNAVSSVLSAWTNWSVYNTTFLDQLECRFEGREYTPPKFDQEKENAGEDTVDTTNENPEDTMKEEQAAVSTVPRGQWTSSEPIPVDNLDGEALENVDGEALDEGLDGAELEKAAVSTVPRGEWTSAQPISLNNIDGEALDGEALEDDLDGEELDDIDGEPLDDIDGVVLEGHEDC